MIGTNTADCHPVTWKRIRKRKMTAPDEVSVIVVDPRFTETADIAAVHLPLHPSTWPLDSCGLSKHLAQQHSSSA